MKKKINILQQIDHWDERHKWFVWRQLGEKFWTVDSSEDGSYPKCPHEGWFVSAEDAREWIRNNSKEEENSNDTIEGYEDLRRIGLDLQGNYNELTYEQKIDILSKIREYQKENKPKRSKIELFVISHYFSNEDYDEEELQKVVAVCRDFLMYLRNSTIDHRDYLKKVFSEWGLQE